MTDISPLRRGETKPDKKTNPDPPVGGRAGRQTQLGIGTTPVRDVTWIGGWLLDMHNLRNPRDPPNSARWSNTTCHRHPSCCRLQPPPRYPVSLQQPPPRGWVGGRTENCLKVKGKQLFEHKQGIHPAVGPAGCRPRCGSSNGP